AEDVLLRRLWFRGSARRECRDEPRSLGRKFCGDSLWRGTLWLGSAPVGRCQWLTYNNSASSSSLMSPSPPSEKATTSKDEAWKAGTGDGTGEEKTRVATSSNRTANAEDPHRYC